MRGAIPPLPQYVFMAWCLVKHRETTLPLPRPFRREVSFLRAASLDCQSPGGKRGAWQDGEEHRLSGFELLYGDFQWFGSTLD
jgi:hypothetical protein